MIHGEKMSQRKLIHKHLVYIVWGPDLFFFIQTETVNVQASYEYINTYIFFPGEPAYKVAITGELLHPRGIPIERIHKDGIVFAPTEAEAMSRVEELKERMRQQLWDCWEQWKEASTGDLLPS